MTSLVEMQGRLNPIAVDMEAIEVIQKMDDAGHNGRMMVLLKKTGGKVIAINMLNVLAVEDEDAGELG